MDKKIFIMAAGPATRWNNYMGVPKQMVKVGNETILHRLARLLKERKQKFIMSVPFNGFFEDVPCPEVKGSKETEIDKFLNLLPRGI